MDGRRELAFELVPAVLDRLATLAGMADGGGPPIMKFEKLIPRPAFAVLDSSFLVLTSLSEPEDLEDLSASFFSSRSFSLGVLVDFERLRGG